MSSVAIIIVVSCVFVDTASIVDAIVFVSAWGNQGGEQRGRQGANNM